MERELAINGDADLGIDSTKIYTQTQFEVRNTTWDNAIKARWKIIIQLDGPSLGGGAYSAGMAMNIEKNRIAIKK